ncbi:MAG: hypothetical protein FWE57_10385, partial [Chitinispirillia bacterium]|nr:hypothetical protein [Chitinispirillia bacterium]
MKKLFLCMMFVLIPNIAYSSERFNLEGYVSRFDSIPIGVVNFKSTNKQVINENRPWEIIANNFDFSGRFHVVKAAVFDSALFIANDIGIYVDGEYTLEGTKISLICNLRDVSTRSIIMSKKYHVDLKNLRSTVHRFSNEVVEALFGDRGIFESRVLFVRRDASQQNIAIMDFDGFNRANVTNNNTVNVFPAFIDKSNVVWTSYLRGKPDIYRSAIAGGASQ